MTDLPSYGPDPGQEKHVQEANKPSITEDKPIRTIAKPTQLGLMTPKRNPGRPRKQRDNRDVQYY
jgi:hypothetical protein